MKFLTAAYSNSGGRGNNEDCADYFTADDGSCGAWLVADGLGGHKDGEVASRIAIETGIQMFHDNSDIDASNITDIFNAANNKILTSQENHFGMKTTLVGLFAKGGEAVWAHVGDTRLYYFSDYQLKFQTKDHSVSQIAVNMGEITLEEIRGHADRSKLLRALGDREDIKSEIAKRTISLRPGDAFLMCTDGFWEYVYETEMQIDLAKAATPDQWLMLMAARLYNRAPENNDNNTAVAVFIR